jgi:hypothetical protein
LVERDAFFDLLEIGTIVKVKDENGDGVLEEAEIEEHEAAEAEIKGAVTAFDAVAFTLEVTGINFATDETTAFTNDADGLPLTRDEFFGLIQLGDIVEVKDRNGDGVLEEAKIEGPEAAEAEIKGAVTAFDAVAFTLEVTGINFATDETTAFTNGGGRCSL